MLFILDHDVDIAVGRMLRQAGHTCFSVGAAGLATAKDDDVSVFADDRRGILLTHDREMIHRRRRNTFGRHILLTCNEWEAAEVLQRHLDEVCELTSHQDVIVLRVSKDGVKAYPPRWE